MAGLRDCILNVIISLGYSITSLDDSPLTQGENSDQSANRRRLTLQSSLLVRVKYAITVVLHLKWNTVFRF